MPIFKITPSEGSEPIFIEAETVQAAIDEFSAIENATLHGDIEEVA
jgi:hypothetical protein